MTIKNTIENLVQPRVWFEFSVTATSPELGNIWPTRRVYIKKDLADKYAKTSAGKIVAGPHGTPEDEAADAAEGDENANGAGDDNQGNAAGGAPKSLDRMNKTELLAEAARLEIEGVTEDNNKAEIKAKIEAKLAE